MCCRGNIWCAILLLAAVWSCQHAGLGAASPTADGDWVPVKTSPRATRANVSATPIKLTNRVVTEFGLQEEGRFGSRTESRGARIQVPTKRTKTTTSTTTVRPSSSTTAKAVSIKKRLVTPRQQGVLVYTTSSTTPVPEDEETKSLSQQVKEGKYGLIQELFSAQPSRPGILSYTPNKEVPKDTEQNFGGLKPDEIWLSEGHMLVLSGFNKDEDDWEPIDDYQAPPRQVKLPSNPSVPPPFLVQLQDGGPTGFVSSKNGFNPALQQFRPPPPGNLRQGNGLGAQPPFPLPDQPFLPPNPELNKTLDEDDPSIYYPPPYDFSFRSEATTELPPGPLVPGIVLPPPPSFFAPQDKSSKPKLVVPGQVDPFDFNFSPPEERPAYGPPRTQRPPTYQPPVQLPVEIGPSIDNQTNAVEPPVDDGYNVAGYPYKEPNVFLHHHGSPLYYLPQPIQYRNVTQIFPPEQQLVYEAPFLPSRKRPTQFKTVVSSTPSPTAIHYTLPPETGVQVSIYTATAPEEQSKLSYYSTTKAPMVVSQEYFTTQKPLNLTRQPTPAPHYYQTLTPKPITHEYFTTEKPRANKAPKNVFYVQELPQSPTPRPVYQQDSFQPSLEYPYKYTTTPAPQFYRPANQGGYYQYNNNYHQPQRPYQDVSHQTQALTNILRNLLNPNYFIQSQQQQQQQAYNPYSFQQRYPSTTSNPIFSGLYTQDDAQYMDDQTKGFFNSFGSKVQHTTPLPAAPAEVALHDDVRVNYRHPRPPVNPDSEFVDHPSYVSYQLPGHGRLGPSHFYYVSPRPPRHAPIKAVRRGNRPRSKSPST